MRSLLLSAAVGLTLWNPHLTALSASLPGSQPATVVVSLPADARLTIDDGPTTSTSTVRRFVTPPLEQGMTYHYTFTAQLRRGDRTVSVSKKVRVRAGEETTVSLWPEGRNEGTGAFVSSSYYPPNVAPTTSFYGTLGGSYGPAYSPGWSAAPRIALFSEQSPSYGAGPPGSYARWATGTLIGR